MPPFFEDLDVRTLQGYRVLLDVDGTLVADGGHSLDPRVFTCAQSLAHTNTVILHSNKRSNARLQTLAQAIGATPLLGVSRKPSMGILRHIPDDARPLIVIGDKWITDGWFARRVGARFIRVRRKISSRDSTVARLAYAIDDLLGRAVEPWSRER